MVRFGAVTRVRDFLAKCGPHLAERSKDRGYGLEEEKCSDGAVSLL